MSATKVTCLHNGPIRIEGEFEIFDPTGATAQYSFDLDGAWQPAGNSNLQLDGGVNFGLNHNTPDTQFYLGVSQRF